MRKRNKIIKNPIMAVVEFKHNELKLIKKHFSKYGNTKDCAEKKGLHPSTIQRLKKTGEAEEDTALKIREYLQETYPEKNISVA